MKKCAAVWFDADAARVFFLQPGVMDETSVAGPVRQRPDGRDGRRDRTQQLFRKVARALHQVDALLVLGPATAKLEFMRYVHEFERDLEPKIVGIETVAHPTDGQLLSYAKHYFELDVRPS